MPIPTDPNVQYAAQSPKKLFMVILPQQLRVKTISSIMQGVSLTIGLRKETGDGVPSVKCSLLPVLRNHSSRSRYS